MQSNTCGSSLAAGANCTVAVTFAPKATGNRTGTLSISDDSQNGTLQTLSLNGTGVVPTVTISPSSVTFPSTPVGVQSTATALTITNSSAIPMNIFGITASSNFAQTNNCGVSLAGGSSCTVMVSFMPTVAGSLTGQLTISDDASPANQIVSLAGAATGFTIDVAQTSVTISAGQTASFDVKTATVGGSYPGTIQLSCGALPPAATCTFTPVALSAGQSSKLKIVTTKGVTPSGSYATTVTGTSNGVSRSDTTTLVIK
jgi:hypothetical protein